MSEALAVIEAPQTLAVVPAEDNAQAVQLGAYSSAGTLKLTAEQAKALASDFPDEAYEVKPTGEVYVSQVHYRRLLNQVFGPGAWALVPRSGWINHAETVCREYALYVRGVFVAEAIGETDYQPDNDRMSYASAAEGCRSNALTRCCKDLGIASVCWDRKWSNTWRSQHCVQVWRESTKKPQWRRKDSEPWYDEKGAVAPGAAPQPSNGSRSSAPTGGPQEAPVLCPSCQKPGRPSKYPKGNKTHFCSTCTTKSEKGEDVKLMFGAPAGAPAAATVSDAPKVDVQHELVEAARILGLTPGQAGAALKSIGCASSKDVTREKLDAAMEALEKAAYKARVAASEPAA